MILMLLVLRLLFPFGENVINVMLISIEAQIRARWRCELEVVRMIAEAAEKFGKKS